MTASTSASVSPERARRASFPDTLIRWGAFPAGLAVAALAALALHHRWMPAMAVQMAAMVAAVLLVVIAERRLPFRAAWRVAPSAERRVDITSMAVLMLFADPLSKMTLLPLVASLAATAAAAIAEAGGRPLGLGLFPAALPLPLQLLLAAAVAELGQYGTHRAAHGVRWMWAMHGFHHNPARVNWLNGFRVNPLNLLWHQLAGLGLLVALGAPEPVIQMLIAFGTVVAVFQHANADLRLDGWNRLLSTADLHRWHHAAGHAQGQCNFGAVLMLWDHVFGTYRRHDAAPAVVGVDGFEPKAAGYLAGLREAARMAWR